MRILLALSALLVSACAQVQVIVPNPRVESPELRGDPGVSFTAGVNGGHVYKAVDDAGQRPPNMDDPNVTGAFDLSGGFQYSPIAPIQFGIEIDGVDGYGASTLVKFQLTGKGTSEAEPGNVPVMLYLRTGGVYGHKSGDQSETFGAGGYNWNGVIRGAYVHAGASMGYRLTPHALLYWGGAFGQYWMNSEVNQDPHSNPVDSGGTYKRGDSGQAYSGGFGAQFNWSRVQFFISGEATSYDYAHTRAHFDPFFHSGVIITPR